MTIIMVGGADTSYLFDSRPLNFTKEGKIQNFLGEEPTPWVGTNGQSCLTTSLVKPLLPFKDRFAVLNGVVMAPNFDGHEQNMNLFMTGNNFGGESFVTHLNHSETGLRTTELDAVIDGFMPATLNNVASTVPLSPNSAESLRLKLRDLKPAATADPALDFIRSRYALSSQSRGRQGLAAAQMLRGFDASPALQSKMMEFKQRDEKAHGQRQFANLISDCFRMGLARSAIWSINDYFDAHSVEIAKGQPKMFEGTMDRIGILLRGLNETPYDATRSMLDVTTVMITSEFSRTMRIENVPIDRVGTNHNSHANTVLLGGKGIRGGTVIGSTDQQTLTEELSKAHLSIDPYRVKTIGRPFDFATLRPREDKPESFDIADHLTIASVINTIYKSFGNPSARYRLMYANKPVAPTLDGLMK